MTAAKRVLLVEDDADIAEIVALHLRDEGYSVEHATNGTTGLRLLEQQVWDALVLDLMLPGTDGLEVCRRARSMERYLPIIITSARGSEMQRVLGLEIGADDYLAKPFSVLELVARVRALLRRVDALARASTGTGTIRLGDLALFALEREVKLAGEPVDLTPREFDLLYFFASNAGKVFSRSELLDRVWGHCHSGYEHTVNTHINRIRTKIEVDPANPRRILTVWGRGYKLSSEGNEP
ncbi:MAG TPA: response regulator transcription factor [Gammaproteobacteria bacterium]|nr:response regulator transcription factor [Gammaproteobacteria bacterium]